MANLENKLKKFFKDRKVLYKDFYGNTLDYWINIFCQEFNIEYSDEIFDKFIEVRNKVFLIQNSIVQGGLDNFQRITCTIDEHYLNS
ncbi:hypothetical protein [Francisella sp. LA112445]|jgi:hypothetical protein|uniref:hypothetical protein n=1 Tax=Francisella sp. LA112445 TaxID=1395624 RepID=UPI001788C7EA|nr:hypothetical protein [Francisella sp. LA112445]QIW10036.1 hypothetical protein FIP56_04805 [Francisella sp. LA112445]